MLLPQNEKIALNVPSGQVPVTVIRSLRRTFQISVSPEDGVIFRVPLQASQGRTDELLRSKAQWIDRMLSRVLDRRRGASAHGFQDGAGVFVLGVSRILRWEEQDAQWPKLIETPDGWRLEYPVTMAGHERVTAARKVLSLWLRRKAEEFFPQRLEFWASRMELRLPELSIKTHRRLWGSCNQHRRSVNLNWKIVSFPPEIIDYVIIHELSHLRFADHSKRFWAEVEKTCPQWRERRKWLRENSHRMILPA
jgi:hypothetical protein